ncbi:MAG: COG1361 S-layer family protein [Thermoproteota archaeon]
MNEKLTLTCLTILLMQALTIMTFAQREIPIDVVDVTWGTASNRIAVGPGDKAVPLTITIQNIGSKVISGIAMRLELHPPFTNLSNGILALSYIPISLQPGQSASAQFMLNVDDDAKTGEYTVPLTIDYIVVDQRTISESSTSQSSETSSSTSSSTDSSIGKSSTSQTQKSRTSSYSTSTSTSSTSFNVQNMVMTKEVGVWLSGKTIIEVLSQIDILTAGEVNEFPIVLRNVGSAGANSLTIRISSQQSTIGASTGFSPLVIQGPKSEWYIQDLPAGSNFTLTPDIFASTEAIDKAYQIQVTLNYRDAVGSIHSETYNLGLIVQGSIKIVLQSVFISPSPVGSGGNFTVSGDILNEGNVAAMYMNATALIAPPFKALDGSSIYLGELDPNTPLPFSLTFGVLNGTADGTYPLDVVFYYKDSLGNTRSFTRTFNVTVMGVFQPPKPPEQKTTYPTLPLIILTLTAIVIITYSFIRRRSRH